MCVFCGCGGVKGESLGRQWVEEVKAIHRERDTFPLRSRQE